MVNTPNKSLNILQKLFEIVLILIGIYLVIQVLRKLLGGSWTIEDIILGLVLFNVGCAITIGLGLMKLTSDFDHLKEQFKSLATDFKKHIGKK